MIKLALVDDHVLLRKSLAQLIGMMEEFEIVFEAGNGTQCIDKMSFHPPPDIMLLDITMPGMDGFQTAEWLTQHYPDTRILALTMVADSAAVLRIVKHGARGYVLKDCEPSELRKALHAIATEGYYFNELFTPQLKRQTGTAVVLTDREQLFLKWACTDLTHKEIARQMKVSPRTIDGYRDTLFRKLQVKSRVGIALYAIRNGIVPL